MTGSEDKKDSGNKDSDSYQVRFSVSQMFRLLLPIVVTAIISTGATIISNRADTEVIRQTVVNNKEYQESMNSEIRNAIAGVKDDVKGVKDDIRFLQRHITTTQP